MPNYSIVINSKFRPFSYDEMIKPVQAMYEQQSKIEEGLSELETKANIWEGLANEQTDEKAYKQYKKYADDLRAAADDLALNGLNASSRQNLYRMKSRYASEITPIEQAYERRRQLADEQRKLSVQYNGALRYDNDFSTMSLDALLDNPELSYQALNGENIAARTSSIVSNLAKSITSDPKYKSILNGQYWQSMQTAGYTPGQIIALAQNRPDAPEELRNLRSLIHNSLRDNPAYNEDWVDYWIGQGAYSGIGGTSYETLANQDHLNPAQRQAMNIAATEHAWRSADRQPYQKEVMGADGSLKTVWVDPVRDGATFEIRDGKRVYTSGTGIGGGASALGMTPERDTNGNLTGRYYDPKTKKYYNADGSICANQKNMTGKDVVTSMLGAKFTADFVNGNKMTPARNDRQSLFHDNFFSPRDAKKIKWDDISESAEDNIRTYVAKNGFPEIIGKKMSDYFDLYEDYDLLSHSRYRIVPKTDDPIGTGYNERTTTRTSVPTSSLASGLPPNNDSIPLGETMFR